MKYDCYTCGHNVYRLKDTSVALPNGEFYIPDAAHIFNDYRYSIDHSISPAAPKSEEEVGIRKTSNGLNKEHEERERLAVVNF